MKTLHKVRLDCGKEPNVLTRRESYCVGTA
jgi:hypothetical protein